MSKSMDLKTISAVIAQGKPMLSSFRGGWAGYIAGAHAKKTGCQLFLKSNLCLRMAWRNDERRPYMTRNEKRQCRRERLLLLAAVILLALLLAVVLR